MSDKWVHPELREGEVFVGNVTGDFHSRIGWKSKRFGEVAYNANGDIISNDKPYSHRPLFVQVSEWEEKRKGWGRQ